MLKQWMYLKTFCRFCRSSWKVVVIVVIVNDLLDNSREKVKGIFIATLLTSVDYRLKNCFKNKIEGFWIQIQKIVDYKHSDWIEQIVISYFVISLSFDGITVDI